MPDDDYATRGGSHDGCGPVPLTSSQEGWGLLLGRGRGVSRRGMEREDRIHLVCHYGNVLGYFVTYENGS